MQSAVAALRKKPQQGFTVILILVLRDWFNT